MNILILGGTRFVGRHLVDTLLARGHDLTLFNRGQSGPAPAGVALRTGDRRGDLSALAQGEWDWVLDCCGYLPREVAASADCLRGRIGRYLFISSISVYADFQQPPEEDAPLARLADPQTEQVDGQSYGGLKALCEAALQQRLGAAALALRPGLIVGPLDPTQRFSYWPARLARARAGEPILAPGRPDAPVQWIDARDLADFIAQLIESGRPTPPALNVVGPSQPLGELLAACAAAAGLDQPRWRWAAMPRLEALGLQAWSDLPLALPDTPAWAGFARVDARAARALGLRCRPTAQTVADTLTWWRGLPAEQQLFTRAGLSPEREAAALAALGEA